MTRTCIAISARFALSATGVPMMFRTVVATTKTMTHTAEGMAGNWLLRYEDPMSQMTRGRKR